VTQERYATPSRHTATHSPTEHQPIDAAFGARIDPYQCHGKAHQSPSHHRQRPHRGGRSAGPSCRNAQRRGSGHNPDPAKARERQRGNTYNELLKLLPTLHPGGDHRVCPPPPTWHGTALTLRPQQRAGAPTSSSSQPNRPHGASLDTSRNRGTPRSTSGRALPRPTKAA
jgi:hypothetical protein